VTVIPLFHSGTFMNFSLFPFNKKCSTGERMRGNVVLSFGPLLSMIHLLQ
jgi:hypothetical protein